MRVGSNLMQLYFRFLARPLYPKSEIVLLYLHYKRNYGELIYCTLRNENAT